MNSQDYKNINLPDEPGVYLFKKNKNILYIGKATSLKDRVRSYFSNDFIATRGPLIMDMVFQSDDINFIKTDSVLEALILESSLIKKHQPRYNTKEKDDRSYNYVVITKEDFPKVLIERGRILEQITNSDFIIKEKFGPFTNGTQLKEAVKIIRKIFPFRDKCKLNQKKACFNYQIGLCPGTCIGAISKKEYVKTIKNIKLFFEAKKTSIIKNLEKEMKVYSKSQEFEKADKIKRTIFALNHIQDVALIKEEPVQSSSLGKIFRVEAYDVAHISGTNTVGVMVVVENGLINNTEYRKFKINESVQNDVLGLAEILRRRFNHPEWNFPDIVVVDGSIAQKNIAEKVLRELGVESIIVAVTKDERHRPKMIQGRADIVHKHEIEILLANSEAHRFAIKYHRELRSKTFKL
jgi:excinuclease ABC subunit C